MHLAKLGSVLRALRFGVAVFVLLILLLVLLLMLLLMLLLCFMLNDFSTSDD